MQSPLKHDLRRSKYRVLGLVGQGQFGRVYCAVHRQSGQLVALKNLEHQRFPTSMFLREVRFLLSLHHPNIVTCRALEHTSTGRYLVMDYCEGGTLRGLMSEESRPSLCQSIDLVLQILAGLEHAHQQGIVHCDIKPENILLNVTATGWKARISDFGIARLTQEMAGTTTGGNTGSPAYMAPERFYGQYSRASDLYAVGILLYELLAGDRPFTGTPTELRSAHLNTPLKLPDTISPIWHPILTTALQKLAARRFRTAAEMAAAIRQVADTETLAVASQTPLSPLLIPMTPLPIVGFRAQQPVPLRYPVRALMAVPSLDQRQELAGVYCGGPQGAWYQPWQQPPPQAQSGDAAVAPSSPPLLLTEPIHEFLQRPQGYFAIAPRTLYHLPTWLEKPEQPLPTLAQPLLQDSLMALDPAGRWMAATPVIQPDASKNPPPPLKITFALLPGRSSAVSLASQQSLPVAPAAANRVLALLGLDSRNVAIALRQFAPPQLEGQTTITVLTRRGNVLGNFSLPLLIHQIHLTPTPYRLVALDERDPQALVIIDLRPFRVFRWGLDIAPERITVLPWGYLLSNAAGQMLLLNTYGQRVGQIAGPPDVTAIAPLAPHLLAIATWDGTRGTLLQCDLRELDLDFMF